MSAPTNSCPQQLSAPDLSALCSRGTPHPLTNCGLNSFRLLRLLPEHSGRTRAGTGVSLRLPACLGLCGAMWMLRRHVIWLLFGLWLRKEGTREKWLLLRGWGQLWDLRACGQRGWTLFPLPWGRESSSLLPRRPSSPEGGRGGNHTPRWPCMCRLAHTCTACLRGPLHPALCTRC